MSTLAAVEQMAPETEVTEKTTRRRFLGKYKRRILAEAEACTKPGELGALLRREGLYSSNLTTWKIAQERGGMEGLAPKKRGPTKKQDERDKKIKELEQQNKRLQTRLKRAEGLIELQKKIAEILGIDLPDPDGKNS